MKNPRIVIILALFLFVVLGSGFAQMAEPEALSKFVSAGIDYKDEQYEEAIIKYNQIIDGGRESGAVYYNLGNSYFRNNQLGKAILNYERAKKFIPRDSDLNFNYRYASSQVEQYGNGEQIGFLRRILGRFIGFYTISEMLLVIVWTVIIFGTVFLLALYMDWPRPIKQGVVIILIVLVSVYGIGLITKINYTKNLAVVLTSTESYFEPRKDSTVHFKLPEGKKVRISRSEGDWGKIERPDGKVGWVPSGVLERI